MEMDPGPGQKELAGVEPGGVTYLGAPSPGIGNDVNDNVSREVRCDVRGCVSDGSEQDFFPLERREGPGSKGSLHASQGTHEHTPPGGGAASGGGSVVLSYVAGRLTEAYRHVGQHVLTTRNLVEKATGANLTGLVSQCLTALSPEPPLTETRQPGPRPDPSPRGGRRRVGLVDLSAGGLLSPGSAAPGSVSSSRSQEQPEMFFQRMIGLPAPRVAGLSWTFWHRRRGYFDQVQY